MPGRPRLRTLLSAALIATLFLPPAQAQRGGGGARPGMGGGARPGMGGGGARPGMGGMGSLGARPGGMGSIGAPRGGFGGGSMGAMRAPSSPSMGNFRPGLGSMPRSAPSSAPIGGLGSRPGLGSNPAGLGSRPSVGMQPGLGSRPGLGSGVTPNTSARSSLRPTYSGGAPGLNASPSLGLGSRPAIGSNPGGAGSRPGLGSNPAFAPGSGRPGLGLGSNPAPGGNAIPGNRPSISSPSGSRPGLQLGSRPGLGSTPGLGSSLAPPNLRPGVGSAGSRPGLGSSPTSPIGGRPGLGANRPDLGLGSRPGLGSAGSPGANSPIGSRPGLGSAGSPGAGPGNNNLAGRPGFGSGPGSRPGLQPGNRPGLGGAGGQPPLAGNGGNSIIGGRPGFQPGQRPGLGGGNWNGGPGGPGGGNWNGGGPGGGNWNGNPIAGGGNWNGGGRGGRGGGYWPGRGPSQGLHNAWVNGYWTGFGDGYSAGSWNNSGWGWGGGGWGGGGWGWGGGGWGGGGWGFGNGFGWGLGNGLGWGLGNGLGWGLSSWLFGSPCYSWGYSSFVNPYWNETLVVQQPVVVGTVAYDYSMPIDTLASIPAQPVADDAMSRFEQARAVFKAGDYQQALALTDSALSQLPQDATLHEFRALCLTMLGRYDEAAAVLYSVLAVGPGWDWPTLVGLYPTADIYTHRLRDLEAYCTANPEKAGPRFVLAYHYLTQDHRDAAATVLRSVTRLQPSDQLAAQLLAHLEPPAPAPAATTAAPAQVQAADTLSVPPPVADAPAVEPPVVEPPVAGGDPAPNATPAAAPLQFPLTGTWKAKPNPSVTITLAAQGDSSFTWTVDQANAPKSISGKFTLGADNLLTLTSSSQSDGALAGPVTWTDADHFNFKLAGSPEADPGLDFTKAP